MKDYCLQAVEAMRRNGMNVVQVQNAAEAKDYLLCAIAEGSTVGVGGSISVRQTGVMEALAEKGCEIFSHWDAAPGETEEVLNKARCADVYLVSANAVTKDGKLVYIDGRGNRVGAICDGPKDVYLIISQSKVVDGGLSAAISRIKSVACPLNTRRLGIDTPCARTGKCNAAECSSSICRLTLVVDRVPGNRRMTVVLVEEPLGY